MTKPDLANRYVKSILNAMGGLGRRPSAVNLEAPGDDLVRILSRLMLDVEEFDSKIRSQRRLIKRHATHYDNERTRRRSKEIGADAAAIATKARGALDELRGLLGAAD
jgi:hypothetical protein